LKQSLKDLGFGIRRHPWKTAGYIFTAFSVIFTVVKATTQFIPQVQIQGPYALSAALLISIAWGLWKVWKPSEVSIKIANCNTTIKIVFGDIFQQDGIRAIAVSEFFDTKLGRPVSDKSLHGIFLKKCFGGYQEAIDKQIDGELANETGTQVPKVEGKDRCYPIGTSAMVKVNDDCYLLFAFAKADPATCKCFSDVELMWRGMHKMWERARVECGGHPLNLPLVGSGLSVSAYQHATFST